MRLFSRQCLVCADKRLLRTYTALAVEKIHGAGWPTFFLAVRPRCKALKPKEAKLPHTHPPRRKRRSSLFFPSAVFFLHLKGRAFQMTTCASEQESGNGRSRWRELSCRRHRHALSTPSSTRRLFVLPPKCRLDLRKSSGSQDLLFAYVSC